MEGLAITVVVVAFLMWLAKNPSSTETDRQKTVMRARRIYRDNPNIKIYKNASILAVDELDRDGTWVLAWVFVPSESGEGQGG